MVGHELTHGVVQYTSGLDYQGEAGALNEHFADAFGIMIRQHARQQTARASDWLIGRELIVPAATRRAIRSLREPGTAYRDDPFLGSDPQPAHYRDRYQGSGDNGGVHINSGIPNHAFYRAATAAGGNAWKTVGPIWYQVMQNLLPQSTFAQFARQLRGVAQVHAQGRYARAVDDALVAVGL
ncbi:MAG: M4 family metallopeptidase [Steroidobacteraceae bacterium]